MEYNKSYIEACKKLGKRIQNLREKKNFSIKEMSIKTGIRVEYLKKIEEGKAYGVKLDKHILKIAIVLNEKIGVLFDFN